jgi:hypothetical protein
MKETIRSQISMGRCVALCLAEWDLVTGAIDGREVMELLLGVETEGVLKSDSGRSEGQVGSVLGKDLRRVE